MHFLNLGKGVLQFFLGAPRRPFAPRSVVFGMYKQRAHCLRSRRHGFHN